MHVVLNLASTGQKESIMSTNGKSNPTTTTTTTIQTAHGAVWKKTTNKNGVTITWEMLCESIGQVVRPHHVEEVSYYLFSAEESYSHSFAWQNILGIKGIGPVTLEKIEEAFNALLEMKPTELPLIAIDPDDPEIHDVKKETNMEKIENNLIAAFTAAVKSGNIDLKKMMQVLKMEANENVSTITGAPSPVSKAALDRVQPVEVEELEKLVQEEEVEVEEVFQLTEKELGKLDVIERQQENRTENYVLGNTMFVYSYDGDKQFDGVNPRTRVLIKQGVQMVGLLEHLWRNNMIAVSPKADKALPAVMHIHSDVKDDRGREMDVSTTNVHWHMVNNRHTPFVMVKGKHMINSYLMKVVAKTFERAADIRAYASGLCAPGKFVKGADIYFGDDKTTKCVINEEFELEEVLDEDGNPVEIDMGADGNMIVHPQHWLPKKLGVSKRGAAFQVRFWEPERGIFIKGIVVVDETAVVDDKPAIICNSSMIKGKYKKQYHLLRGKTIKMPGTVLNVWDRPHHKDTSRGSFEWLQMLVKNEATEEGVRDSIQRFWWNFEARGGRMQAYLHIWRRVGLHTQ
ncbi:MAG: hypothetical protein EB165_04375 [Euryarchaeota archaeon]|nr:hypothetical protein [Euryarchaeota archaeon]